MHLIKVNDRFEFTVDPEDHENWDIVRINAEEFHILHANRSFRIMLESADPLTKQYVIKVNGRRYTISLEDEKDQMLKKLGFSKKKKSHSNEVKAPMPGLVLDVFARLGEKISKGDSLLILEAMKMENIIKAGGEGIIKKVHVNKGMAVEKNQILIELE